MHICHLISAVALLSSKYASFCCYVFIVASYKIIVNYYFCIFRKYFFSYIAQYHSMTLYDMINSKTGNWYYINF